ncbi:MAG: efflux RND transporter permease subunit, partial [Bacteroidales bacterium]|nr:efflux RND transporter permease subunit [Bacteroidales bacterium]
IKQSDARMADLRENLHSMVENFRTDYPQVEFTVTRDQTNLLDYSINNLKQSLIAGGILAFLIMFLFLKDVRSPFLIGITIPSSLIISLLFFYMGGLSLNIISLSGLILGIGMMIDNSIIVIDNITQFRERGYPLGESCVLGTNEVFRPMLSSVLTTCAVFIPLIFIGGISGALFYDQALAITIGLFVSLAVSVTLLPVYYRLAYLRGNEGRGNKWLSRINRLNYEKIYERGFRFTMRNQPLIWFGVMLMLGTTFFLYTTLDKEKMPPLTRTDVLLRINWNARINIDENNRRVNQTLTAAGERIIQNTSLIGQQEFMMEHGASSAGARAEIYFLAQSQKDLEDAIAAIQDFLQAHYPEAVAEFEDTGNIFDLLFAEKQSPLVIRLRATKDYGPEYNKRLQETVNDLSLVLSGSIPPVAGQEQILLKVDKDKLVLYDTDQSRIVQALKNAFSENQVLLITGNQDFIPVKIGETDKTLEEIINTITVLNTKGEPIRLASFLRLEKDYDLASIVSGKEGEYFPLPLNISEKEVAPTINKVNRQLAETRLFEAGFSGSYFSNREMIRNLTTILLISLLLLYFILASQFESLTLPLIVLLEIPVDLFGALLFLKLFGGSINLMS